MKKFSVIGLHMLYLSFLCSKCLLAVCWSPEVAALWCSSLLVWFGPWTLTLLLWQHFIHISGFYIPSSWAYKTHFGLKSHFLLETKDKMNFLNGEHVKSKPHIEPGIYGAILSNWVLPLFRAYWTRIWGEEYLVICPAYYMYSPSFLLQDKKTFLKWNTVNSIMQIPQIKFSKGDSLLLFIHLSKISSLLLPLSLSIFSFNEKFIYAAIMLGKTRLASAWYCAFSQPGAGWSGITAGRWRPGDGAWVGGDGVICMGGWGSSSDGD
jgi:hypothetical protein